ncbi:hypothetical protein L3X40_21585 [Rhizorhapis sp. SPR117]|nr:hypothetical protein [Rhizorhapis sp. SPR117]
MSGLIMDVDMSCPTVIAHARQVNDINAFMSRQHIDPDCHYAFHRLFNQGDAAGFNWNKGGRLYSLGGGYQSYPQTDRKLIKINGEPVVEIDIRASHLTILHALMKIPFDPSTDPYGIADLPRSVVKSWVTMTLGNDKFQEKWSDGAKERFQEEFGQKLQAEYPLKETRTKILSRLPILSNWETSPYRWGELQYLESCAIIDAVHKLAMVHKVCALPVHDSLIVPISQQAIAEKVLKEEFNRHIGVVPIITVK